MPVHSLTAFAIAQGVFRHEPATLLDIGCSGGIHSRWRAFEPDLVADCIDPMRAECERLRAMEANPRVHYHACFLGLGDDHPFVQRRAGRDLWGNNPWTRLSIYHAQQQQRRQRPAPRAEEIYQSNRWTEACSPQTVPTLTPREFLQQQRIERIDFLKIDVDGRDLEILIDLEETLDRSPVLGVLLEVNFYGTDFETDNTFHNMDRLMRRHGFELFSLTTIPYSRQALPAPFRAPMPSATTFGPPVQGDVIYVRDIASADARELTDRLSDAQILKTACFFEAIGLPDCAAEVLQQHKRRLEKTLDVQAALNCLVPLLQGRQLVYDDYVREFNANIEAFYPYCPPPPSPPVPRPVSPFRPRLSKGAKALGVALAGAGVGVATTTLPLLGLGLMVGGATMALSGRWLARRAG